MKSTSNWAMALLLAGMLLAVDRWMGHRVLWLASTFSAIWFLIAIILLSRPPGIPEFVSERPGSDEQFVVRRDVVPRLPLAQRLSLSLLIACGSCLLVCLTLVLLGG